MTMNYLQFTHILAILLSCTQAYVLHSTNDAHQRWLDEEAVIKSDIAFHFYPEAMALQRVYSCCIYSDTSERGMICDLLDDECHEDFRQAMNVYYILGLILFLMMIATFAFELIRAKINYNPVKKQAGLVKKRETRE